MALTPASWQQRTSERLSHYILPAGLLCLLCGLFFVPHSSIYHKLYYALFALPTVIALVMSPRAIRAISSTPIIRIFVVYACWSLLTLLWSQSDSSNTTLIKRPFYILLLFAGCSLMALYAPKQLSRSMKTAAILIIPTTLYSLWLFEHRSELRLIGSGALDNPLLTSHIIGFFTALWLAYALNRSKQVMLIALAPIIVLLSAIFATGSRTAILAITLTALWLVACRVDRRAWAMLGFLCIATALLAYLSPETLLQRGMSYRVDLWQSTLIAIQNHPFIGHGLNSELMLSGVVPNSTMEEPHNFALGVWYYTGAIGLILWLAMYASAVMACWKNRQRSAFQIAGALLIYGLGAGLTEGGNVFPRPNESWFVIWIPLAITTALSLRNKITK